MQTIGDLSGLSELEFEARRAKIINDHMKSLPEDQRKKALAFQLQLDLKRETMGPEAFMEHCFKQMGTNLEKISSHFEVLKALVCPPPSLPNYADERKAKI